MTQQPLMLRHMFAAVRAAKCFPRVPQQRRLLVLSLLLFAACLGLGLSAVLLAARSERNHARGNAASICESAVSELLARFSMASAPGRYHRRLGCFCPINVVLMSKPVVLSACTAMMWQGIARTSPNRTEFQAKWASAMLDVIDDVRGGLCSDADSMLSHMQCGPGKCMCPHKPHNVQHVLTCPQCCAISCAIPTLSFTSLQNCRMPHGNAC